MRTILGPKRLGDDAGVSCHGMQMLDFIGEMEGVAAPVCLVWGDQDFAAPPPVPDVDRPLAARAKSLALHVFPACCMATCSPAMRRLFPLPRAPSRSSALPILAGLRDETLREAS